MDEVKDKDKPAPSLSECVRTVEVLIEKINRHTDTRNKLYTAVTSAAAGGSSSLGLVKIVPLGEAFKSGDYDGFVCDLGSLLDGETIDALMFSMLEKEERQVFQAWDSLREAVKIACDRIDGLKEARRQAAVAPQPAGKLGVSDDDT